MSNSSSEGFHHQSRVLHLIATLVASGACPADALSAAAKSFDAPGFPLGAMHLSMLDEGKSFAQAFAEHSGDFAPFVSELISAGEESCKPVEIGKEISSIDATLFLAADLTSRRAMLARNGGPFDEAEFLRAVDFDLLALLFEEGFPWLRSFEIVAQHSISKNKAAFAAVAKEIKEAGNSVAVSISGHPDVFPPYMCAMVEAGETQGVLDIILRQIADHLMWVSVGRPISGVRPPKS